MDASAHSLANVMFLMNFSCDVIQKVTNLNMDIHGATGEPIDEHTDKLVRDAIIWTHLGGDASQRLKVMRRMKTASIAPYEFTVSGSRPARRLPPTSPFRRA